MLVILDHRAECYGPFLRTCLLTPGDAQGGKHLLYDYIEGFRFEWGYVYSMFVDEYTIPNPPQDAPGTRVEFKRMVAKTRVPAGTEFDVLLSGYGAVPTLASPGVYTLLNDGRFTCTDATECAALVAALQMERPVMVRFAHPASAQAALLLVRWVECTRLASGQTSCPPLQASGT